jgi:hypothetical protein
MRSARLASGDSARLGDTPAAYSYPTTARDPSRLKGSRSRVREREPQQRCRLGQLSTAAENRPPRGTNTGSDRVAFRRRRLSSRNCNAATRAIDNKREQDEKASMSLRRGSGALPEAGAGSRLGFPAPTYLLPNLVPGTPAPAAVNCGSPETWPPQQTAAFTGARF